MTFFKKTLVILFGLANLAIVIFAWWQFSGDLVQGGTQGGILLAFGRLAGLLATLLILTQLILIGRVKWVECLWGLDRLSRAHRVNGSTAIALVFLHPFLITLGYSYLNGTPFISQAVDNILHLEDVLSAFLAWVILMITVGITTVIIRRTLKYETWYYVHIFNYLAIALFFGHQFDLGSASAGNWFQKYWAGLYIFTVLNLLIFRFGMPLWNFYTYRFKVARIAPEPSNTTSVYIEGRNLDKFKIQAGQFMIVRFWQKGFWWQAHPFSMSIGPNPNTLRLSIKASGDFTATIPQLKAGMPVIIDGPHGVFTEQAMRRDKVLYIAGGIGITPIRSMIEAMGDHHGNSILLYANRTERDIVFKEELETIAPRTGLKIYHFFSDPAADTEVQPQSFKGYIDRKALESLVPDLRERDVYLCGPPPMMGIITKTLRELGLPKNQIHFEKFSLV